MGRLSAIAMTETDLTLEQQITWHLQSNCFPPVPKSMVEPCVKALEAYNAGNKDKLIGLPKGVGYQGLTAAPANAIIQAHRLTVF
jgi:hypothetical protein